MITERCIPLTMKIMGSGRPLYDAERLAAVILVRVFLLCAMKGYLITIPGLPEMEPGDRS
ncbi:MAG: hypothetical protein PHT99_03120 [Methanoregula sp.]|nr:hypothetical protein [Methanoregula sp.]